MLDNSFMMYVYQILEGKQLIVWKSGISTLLWHAVPSSMSLVMAMDRCAGCSFSSSAITVVGNLDKTLCLSVRYLVHSLMKCVTVSSAALYAWHWGSCTSLEILCSLDLVRYRCVHAWNCVYTSLARNGSGHRNVTVWRQDMTVMMVAKFTSKTEIRVGVV